MRHLFLAALVCVCAIVSSARGGAVEIQSTTALKADVTANLGGVDSPTDSKESHDTGDLTKPNVTASASASVPLESGAFSGSGDAEAHLAADANGFVLTGQSSASLAGATALPGEVRSAGAIDLSFTISDGFFAIPQFEATITHMVKGDEKVTLVINRSGQELQAVTFHDDFNGQLKSLGAGSYQLQVVTGAIATNKGISGETGSASFRASLAAAPIEQPPTAIPLPSGISTGAAGLAAALLLLNSRRFRVA